jgi:hypothetical protein
MKREPESKIGDGHASAMFRQGLRELRASLYPESNVAQHPEYGLYGTLTPGEVAASRAQDAPRLEDEPQQPSVLDKRLEAAMTREDRSPQKDSPELER